jgi:hypothetical protein
LNAYTDQAKSNKEALDKAIKHKAKNQNELHVKCKIGMGYSLIAEGELALAELELKDAEQTATELAAKAGIEFKPAGAAETKAAGNAQR